MDHNKALQRAYQIIALFEQHGGFDSFWDMVDIEVKAEIVNEIANVISVAQDNILKEENSPKGMASIVEDSPIDQFEPHDEDSAG